MMMIAISTMINASSMRLALEPGYAWRVRLLATSGSVGDRPEHPPKRSANGLVGDESSLDALAPVEQPAHSQAQHGASGFENLAPRDLGLA